MAMRLLAKTGIIGCLSLLLLVPLCMIDDLADERQVLRDAARREIADSSVREQLLAGPFLVISYRERVDGSLPASIVQRRLVIAPEQLEVDAVLTTEPRYRGIHKALLYTTAVKLTGSFAVADGWGIVGERLKNITWESASLVVGVRDPRGIQGQPSVQWRDESVAFSPGTGLSMGGMQATIGALPPAGGVQPFAIALTLLGTERFDVAPIGKDMSVHLQAAWPHPKFMGSFLPVKHHIDGTGFTADWRVTQYASNAFAQSTACDPFAGNCDGQLTPWLSQGLGVALIEPVDIYRQLDRALKYGVLFIGLTFAIFFLFEILKRAPIHPFQYTLVGLALAIFYLLLLSLSEHFPFAWSYAVASSSCVGLLFFYLGHVLGGIRRSLGFAALLSVLYAALYVLLQLENLALLVGSVGLFAILAAVMVITRRIDWYRAFEKPATSPATSPCSWIS